MGSVNQETVLSVRHWNDTLFSFTTTRSRGLRFKNGHFLMVGLEVEGKPLLRAYSVASPNYEEHLEFYSIKVQNGPLTSRLQHLKVGEHVILTHGVRNINDLAYSDYIKNELPQHEFLGEQIQKQLIYYPTVTREAF